MKILLAGGGTAGHINPAVAIADYAVRKDENTEILFVGTQKGLEKTLVPKAGYKIKYIKVEGLSKKLTLKNIKSLYHMITAKQKCKKIIREFKPDVVVGTGGYVCAPAVMAANSLGIPTLIHEQNVFPGSAIRLLSKTSTVTAISFEESRKYLGDAVELLMSGNPIRPEILACNREYARNKMEVGDKKFVLIFGGSLGAGKINDVAIDFIMSVRPEDNIKILFATGQRNYDEVMSKLNKTSVGSNPDITVVPYVHNMDEAMNAADVAVCRSGAITVSELSALAKPAILIPSPNVTNNHQEYNARALSDNGAAITILEKDFSVTTLSEALSSLLDNDEALKDMSIKSAAVSNTNALDIIYNRILKLV